MSLNKSIVSVGSASSMESMLKCLVFGFLRTFGCEDVDNEVGLNPFTFLKKKNMVNRDVYLVQIIKWLRYGVEMSINPIVKDCFKGFGGVWGFLEDSTEFSLNLVSVLGRLLGRRLVVVVEVSSRVGENGIIPYRLSHYLCNAEEKVKCISPSLAICLLKEGSKFALLTKFSEGITNSKKKKSACLHCGVFVDEFKHVCDVHVLPCKACQSQQCNSVFDDTTYFNYKCLKCNNSFYDSKCYIESHSSYANWCAKNMFCGICHKRYDSIDGHTHKCGEIKCSSCNVYYTPFEYHSCLMWRKFTKDNFKELYPDVYLPPWAVIPGELANIAAYDFETAAIDDSQEVVCGCLIDSSGTYTFDSINAFLFHLLTPEYNKYHVFAHNGSSFDCVFVVNALTKLASLKEGYRTDKGILYVNSNKSLTKGNRFMRLQVFFSYVPVVDGVHMKPKNNQYVVFRDSCLLFPRTLREFAKSMDVEIGKGFFPYRLNGLVIGNHAVEVDFPEKEVFDVGKSYQGEFDAWYEKELVRLNGRKYRVWDEMVKYCVQDTVALLSSLHKFREAFLLISDSEVDPLAFNTAASFAQAVFLSRYAPPVGKNTSICLLNEPRKVKKTESEKEYMRFILGTKPDEQLVYGVSIGDYVPTLCTVKGTEIKVYEFKSCHWNAHDCSFLATSRDHKWRKKHAKNIDSFIKSVDDISIQPAMWECEWREFKKKNNALKRLWETTGAGDKFGIDIFKVNGGVTEVYANMYTCADDEEIVCFDVVSEYPSVQKYCPFPIGAIKYKEFKAHDLPDFIQSMLESQELITHATHLSTTVKPKVKYFGMFHVRVTPPLELFAPVIAVLWNDKRYFSLCSLCAKSENQEKCDHSNTERSFWVTLTTADIVLALRYGYTINEVSEGWFCPESSVDWNGGDYSLRSECYEFFGTYVDELIKIKQEAGLNGNKALREVAKLLLNSLWGKIGQRLAYSKKEVIFHNEEGSEKYKKLREDPNLKDFENIIYPEFMITSCKHDDSYLKYNTSRFTNHIVANFVTAYGRAKLLSAVNTLNEHGHTILYVDTDSVTFVKKVAVDFDIPGFPVGTNLGEWESEADKIGGFRIKEFLSTGRKMYAWFGEQDGDRIPLKCRTKGISSDNMGDTVELLKGSLTTSNLTWSILKSLLDGEDITLTETRFETKQDLRIVINADYQKVIKKTIRHRVFKEGLSLPYGHK